MTKEDKTLKKQSLQKNLENAKKEIENISKAFDEQLKRKELLVEKMSNSARMHEIAMRPGGLVSINPTWAFQKDPDYIEAQRAQSEWEFKFKTLNDEQTLKSINDNLAIYEEQIASQAKNVEETEKKLQELGE